MEMRQPEAKGADRVLSVFKSLARYPRGATLDELAERLGSPKSPVHRAPAPLRPPGAPEQVGGRNPAHCTGLGKLLLAYALPTEEAVDAYAATHPLVARTSGTLVTPAAL